MTDRQQKAINKMVANGGNMRGVLRGAGYSEAYAKNPQKFKATKAGRTFLKTLKAETLAALNEAKRKRKKANYRDCIHAAETLNKMSRLETGEITDRIGGGIVILPARNTAGSKPLTPTRKRLKSQI